jgi:hypothetical protein
MNDVIDKLLDIRYRVCGPFRRRRHKLFLQCMRPRQHSVILDIGGMPNWWIQNNYQGKVLLGNISIGNMHDPAYCSYRNLPPNIGYVQLDGRHIPFRDKSFDIVFSNSVIEHVGEWKDQKELADEVARVGISYWIQTPYRHFPIEPHFNFIFFQYFPLSIRLVIAKYWPFSWAKRYGHDPKERVRSIRLLTIRELRALFPTGRVYRERAFGFTKSIVSFSVSDNV